VRPGEVVALVGESGSGKSTTAHALIGLLPDGGRVTSGDVALGAEPLTGLLPDAWRRVRGVRVGLVPQDPGTALDPVMRVGEQVAEALVVHGTPRRAARERAVEILREVGLDHPGERARQYPHQLSGGMRQRVLVGIAMACEPELVIADEPTFGLDADLVATTAAHLRAITSRGAALLLITHDLRLAEQMGGGASRSRLAVSYASYLVELRESGAFFAGVRGAPEPSPPGGHSTRIAPQGIPAGDHAGAPPPGPAHPYSRALLRAMPEFGGRPIPGASPELSALPAGCPFQDRCPEALPVCATSVPPPFPLSGYVDKDGSDDVVRCHLHAPR
jgi:oligopeptide/dipeptide ABC transporter ATP-binding protein